MLKRWAMEKTTRWLVDKTGTLTEGKQSCAIVAGDGFVEAIFCDWRPASNVPVNIRSPTQSFGRQGTHLDLGGRGGFDRRPEGPRPQGRWQNRSLGKSTFLNGARRRNQSLNDRANVCARRCDRGSHRVDGKLAGLFAIATRSSHRPRTR